MYFDEELEPDSPGLGNRKGEKKVEDANSMATKATLSSENISSYYCRKQHLKKYKRE